MAVSRITLIVLDSVGCGDAPDAESYGDLGADTLGNIATAVGGLSLPNLMALGLGNISSIQGVPPAASPSAAYGRLTEVSAGKDTTTGHWELAGIELERPFPVYPKGFPTEVMDCFEKRTGRSALGNYPASGTEIINDLGAEHIRSGKPIVYTSADSVFQIAAHEDVIPVDELYRMCRVARDLLQGKHAVGRVIARPFVGRPGAFTRTERRKDFSLEPTSDTILDVLKSSGRDVIGIGKIEDIFANRGLTDVNHTGNNRAGVDATVEFLKTDTEGLIFTNLVDFDSLYGHRNDPVGYARALEAFDRRVPDLLAAMRDDDVLMLTADHGNDPTYPGTDHTRERVPILVVGNPVPVDRPIGDRRSYADVAATIGDWLGVEWAGPGDSFAPLISQ